MTATIIAAILASNGLFALVQFLIKRHDEKNGKTAEMSQRLGSIDNRLAKNERDSCRTQMLILMLHYPRDISAIMKLAEHYFSTLNGDWYMTNIFNQWLEDNGIGKPEWFGGAE